LTQVCSSALPSAQPIVPLSLLCQTANGSIQLFPKSLLTTHEPML